MWRVAVVLLVTLTTAMPASAGSKSDNLKWRSAKSSSQTASNVQRSEDQSSIDKRADKASSASTIAVKKSVVKVAHEEPVSKSKFSKAEPAELAAEPATRPIKSEKVRSRVTVERLSEASPSPHSGGTTDGGSSSLKILRTSNEEPKIDPFADDLQLARPAKPVVNERAVQAGLQERSGRSAVQDPFGDEPKLEQVPGGMPPDRLPPDEVTQAPSSLPANCPTPRDYVKKLADISTNIAAEPGEFPAECGLGDEDFVPRNWENTLYAWKASALCHKPLYFEDVELERYGQTCSPLFQPLLSAAKFYLTLPILPYKMGLETPCECIYPLGYYRPGSCAPFIIPPVPISLRGALLEAGVWVAGVALVP